MTGQRPPGSGAPNRTSATVSTLFGVRPKWTITFPASAGTENASYGVLAMRLTGPGWTLRSAASSLSRQPCRTPWTAPAAARRTPRRICASIAHIPSGRRHWPQHFSRVGYEGSARVHAAHHDKPHVGRLGPRAGLRIPPRHGRPHGVHEQGPGTGSRVLPRRGTASGGTLTPRSPFPYAS